MMNCDCNMISGYIWSSLWKKNSFKVINHLHKIRNRSLVSHKLLVLWSVLNTGSSAMRDNANANATGNGR